MSEIGCQVPNMIAAVNCATTNLPSSTSSIPWYFTATIAPILTALFGLIIAWIAISFDKRKNTNQELIKKRISVYEDIAPRANDILCYFTCIGPWRTLDPSIIINHKREMDRSIYVYGALFSQDLEKKFHDFIHLSFSTFNGMGQPAKLRANISILKQQWGTTWKPEWDQSFVSNQPVNAKELRESYHELLNQFSVEIGARRRHARRTTRLRG